MLLHQIRQNYISLSAEKRVEVVRFYRTLRLAELETPTTLAVEKRKKSPSTPKKEKAKTLSAAEKEILKKLGVSLKSLKTME